MGNIALAKKFQIKQSHTASLKDARSKIFSSPKRITKNTESQGVQKSIGHCV